MIASLLYGKQIVMVSKKTVKKVQAVENRVYRYLLGVAGYVAVAALRGEIGASRMETRILETVLLFCERHINRNI